MGCALAAKPLGIFVKKFIFTFLLLFTSSSLYSFPDEFYPLRVLITESQYIVIGFARTFPASEDEDINSIVDIKILSVLKGKIDSSIIKFRFDGGFLNMCPSDAYYQDSTYVLAFLNKDKNSNYFTYGLSDGSKTISLANIPIYESLIKEMLLIDKIKNTEERVNRISDWLVECAKHEITRYDGVAEIASDLNRQIFNFYTGSAGSFEINDFQKETLRNILSTVDTVKFYDLDIVEILIGFDNPFLSEWISEKLANNKFEKNYDNFIGNSLEEKLAKINQVNKTNK